MDIDFIKNSSVAAASADAMEGIDIYDIFIAQVKRVLVCKCIIFSGRSKIPDAVAGKHGYLHAVVIDIQPSAPFEQLVAGKIKQVIDVKLIDFIRCQVIMKIRAVHINRIFDINAVIPEIQQGNYFFMMQQKAGKNSIIYRNPRILQKASRFQVSIVCIQLRIKAAEADMLAAVCNI